MIRERIGPYRLLRRIGSGGMASVFEAQDERLGHRVAIKLLHPHIGEKAGAAERFLREGRATGRIRHPHVVQVHALGEDDGLPYLAMELLEGRDLAAMLAREGRLSVARALDLLLPVMDAVAAAHDAGVIHRDLKPSNVFIATGPQGRPWPKVVDFGISKLTIQGDAKDLTATDAVVGTAAYMAPEQARAVRNATFRSDQYALGVILYECVTGEQPFAGGSLYEILQAIMTTPVSPPSARVNDVPSALDAVVLRAMSRDPDARFATVRDFGAALLPFASERARLAWSADHPVAPTEGAPGLDSDAAFAPTDEMPRPQRTSPEALGGTLAASTVGEPANVAPRARSRVIAAAMTLLVVAGFAIGIPWRARARARAHVDAPSSIVAAETNAPVATAVVPSASASSASSASIGSSATSAPLLAAPTASSASSTPVAVPRRVVRPVSSPLARPRAPIVAARPSASPAASSAPASDVTLGDNNAPILP